MQKQFAEVIRNFKSNQAVFGAILSGLSNDFITWRSEPGKWNLLEIICHLYDEEREDFRARLKHVLEHPELPMPEINPVAWVKDRQYENQDFQSTLENFLNEREQSIVWLNSLQDPAWENAYQHPKFGAMSAKMFMVNWLAHDYLHIRQIHRLKFDYLKSSMKETLKYAGEW